MINILSIIIWSKVLIFIFFLNSPFLQSIHDHPDQLRKRRYILTYFMQKYITFCFDFTSASLLIYTVVLSGYLPWCPSVQDSPGNLAFHWHQEDLCLPVTGWEEREMSCYTTFTLYWIALRLMMVAVHHPKVLHIGGEMCSNVLQHFEHRKGSIY